MLAVLQKQPRLNLVPARHPRIVARSRKSFATDKRIRARPRDADLTGFLHDLDAAPVQHPAFLIPQQERIFLRHYFRPSHVIPSLKFLHHPDLFFDAVQRLLRHPRLRTSALQLRDPAAFLRELILQLRFPLLPFLFRRVEPLTEFLQLAFQFRDLIVFRGIRERRRAADQALHLFRILRAGNTFLNQFQQRDFRLLGDRVETVVLLEKSRCQTVGGKTGTFLQPLGGPGFVLLAFLEPRNGGRHEFQPADAVCFRDFPVGGDRRKCRAILNHADDFILNIERQKRKVGTRPVFRSVFRICHVSPQRGRPGDELIGGKRIGSRQRIGRIQTAPNVAGKFAVIVPSGNPDQITVFDQEVPLPAEHPDVVIGKRDFLSGKNQLPRSEHRVKILRILEPVHGADDGLPDNVNIHFVAPG
nr:MAG TPA: hypothetical protein [Caudoviricetes sp.]